jgi:esterase/lipase superfamily enzyme
MKHAVTARLLIGGCAICWTALTVGCLSKSPPDAKSANSASAGAGDSSGFDAAEDYAHDADDSSGDQSFSVGAAAPPDEALDAAAEPIEAETAITPRMGMRAQGADAGRSAFPPPTSDNELLPKSAAPDAGGYSATAAPEAPSPDDSASGPAEWEAQMAGQGFATLEVFYATDRQARAATLIADRAYVERFYPMALCAALTALAIALAPLVLKRPLGPLWTWLGAGGTAALGLAAAWSCVLLWQGARRAGEIYGPERGELTLGTCRVSIPAIHKPGEMERPSILRLEINEEVRKHIVLRSALPLTDDAFYEKLEDRVSRSSSRDAFVFVHGFDNTFDEAARRTAQIAADLKFEGAPICYSWPSQGNLLKYTVDENNVEWTIPHLRQFLTELAERSGAEAIHLVAHSMGNRALTGALRSLSRDLQGSPLFNQVVLTAPDIDADVFRRDIAPAILGTARRVTLYASATDDALLLSKKVHGFPRAGDTGRDLVVVPGMDTIDVTGIDTSLLGHAYYAANETVLTDLVQLLKQNLPPDRRELLLPSELNGQRYWIFQAGTRTARPSAGASR